MKAILSLLLLLGSQQYSVPNATGANASPGCVAPSATARWTAYNPSNTCNSGCTNGHEIATLADLVGSNNAVGSTSHFLIYDSTTTVNGLATIQAGVSEVPAQILTSAIANTGSVTFYAIVKPNSGCTTSACIILGNNTSVSATKALGWYLATTLKPTAFVQGTGGGTIGTATTAVSTSSFKTIVLEYTFSGGATAFYICSGGTCSADGTATSSFTTTAGTDTIGNYFNFGAEYQGNIGEIGYFTTASSGNRSAIAAWSQCKYGI